MLLISTYFNKNDFYSIINQISTAFINRYCKSDGPDKATYRVCKSMNNNLFLYFPYSKVNPADCVDMDCDALKKTILRDEDGTFLGTAGASVIPESEWEWDGDPRRGLGDYRIPKTLITTLDGNRIEVSTLADHYGMLS